MPGVAFSCVPTSDLGISFPDSTTFSHSISGSVSSSNSPSPSTFCCCIPLNLRSLRSHRTHGSSTSRSGLGDPDLEFLQASVLVAETSMHYKMRRHGFQEDSMWKISRRLPPFSVRASESRVGGFQLDLAFFVNSSTPTIFLKIFCDGDYLLPIIVGEAAVEKLLDEGENEACPDQFQSVSSVVDKLGYEVKMVKLISSVVNTYYASLYLGKPGDNDFTCFDLWPSDAINIASACQVFSLSMKPNHLVSSKKWLLLYSAPEGPDPLSEELKLVINMDLASKEERYIDAGTHCSGCHLHSLSLRTPPKFSFLKSHLAAMGRDILKKLQNSSSVVDKGVATPESYD